MSSSMSESFDWMCNVSSTWALTDEVNDFLVYTRQEVLSGCNAGAGGLCCRDQRSAATITTVMNSPPSPHVLAQLISPLCRDALLTSAPLTHPGLILLSFFLIVPSSPSSVSSPVLISPQPGAKVTSILPWPCDTEGPAVNGAAAETRYGDRRFNAVHVRHYRWAYLVVQQRTPTIHQPLSLFNLEDCR